MIRTRMAPDESFPPGTGFPPPRARKRHHGAGKGLLGALILAGTVACATLHPTERALPVAEVLSLTYTAWYKAEIEKATTEERLDELEGIEKSWRVFRDGIRSALGGLLLAERQEDSPNLEEIARVLEETTRFLTGIGVPIPPQVPNLLKALAGEGNQP